MSRITNIVLTSVICSLLAFGFFCVFLVLYLTGFFMFVYDAILYCLSGHYWLLGR